MSAVVLYLLIVVNHKMRQINPDALFVIEPAGAVVSVGSSSAAALLTLVAHCASGCGEPIGHVQTTPHGEPDRQGPLQRRVPLPHLAEKRSKTKESGGEEGIRSWLLKYC
jgi:hypothetical protein